MLRVPNFVKGNYTIACANSQKLYCWVCYFLHKGLHLKITETACVSMLALKINYDFGVCILAIF